MELLSPGLYNQAGVISCVSLLTASHANVGNLKDSPSHRCQHPNYSGSQVAGRAATGACNHVGLNSDLGDDTMFEMANVAVKGKKRKEEETGELLSCEQGRVAHSELSQITNFRRPRRGELPWVPIITV